MTGLVALAFVTGMLSPANPCGFALLPAYLAYHSSTGGPDIAGRLVHGLRAGAAVTVGFAGVFAIAAVAVGAGMRALLATTPWFGLIVGALVAVAGLWLVFGGALPQMRLPVLSRAQAPDTSGSSFWRFSVFGAAYAVASLSCALPMLVAFTGQAMSGGNGPEMIGIFAAFAGGVATILVPLSIVAGFTGGSLGAALRRVMPALPRIAGGVLSLTGVYLVFYWAPAVQGGGPDSSPLSQFVTDTAARANNWLSANQTAAVSVAIGIVAVTFATVAWAGTRRTDNPPLEGRDPT